MIRPCQRSVASGIHRSHHAVVRCPFAYWANLVVGSRASPAASAGVKWFEVDKLDVLNAKRRSLEAAGASCKPDQGALCPGLHFDDSTCAPDAWLRQQILPGMQAALAGTPSYGCVGICSPVHAGHGGHVPPCVSLYAPGSARYPLKAAAWVPLEADLSETFWSTLLIAAGFHPELPTVWLAEGLLMYLQPPAVDAMLREMAGAGCLSSLECSTRGMQPQPCPLPGCWFRARWSLHRCETIRSHRLVHAEAPICLRPLFVTLWIRCLCRRLRARLRDAGDVCDGVGHRQRKELRALPRPPVRLRLQARPPPGVSVHPSSWSQLQLITAVHKAHLVLQKPLHLS